ncbi:PepSY-like domain-containing protein [Alistipes finegoldii]|uniref:PepSY-like domain-containing protein n=1 Tax=Alistipes finegoldii TaxID=214856 RepID=UPI001D097554|nr:PepSY-like domain-containing protein [Alistipes finegoldii]MCB6684731.1 PepSY-like domain-containing protein [Alistipes finegoldii]
MKKFAVLMLALASLGAMTGCDDDDDSVKVPAAVQDTFGRMFPGAGHVEWAGKQGYLVAEFREGGTDMQAWFDAAGKWYMTEEDVPYALLPQAVRTAFESGEYAAWHVDDADKLTREGLETVYVLEVEQRDAEYELVYSEDGVLLRAVPDADGDRDHGDMLPQELPQAVKDFIGRKYVLHPKSWTLLGCFL